MSGLGIEDEVEVRNVDSSDILDVEVETTPKNMGSFVFKFHVNQYKTPLYEADGTQYVYSWTQSVT